MDLLLKNVTIITQNTNRDIFTGDIWIEKNSIKEIGTNLNPPVVPQEDFSHLVVLPGLIQTHIHLCQSLFRNLADDMELLVWLEQRIWPMEMAHSENSLRASARLGLSELLLSGVTSILDMGNARFMDVVFEEMEISGIRGFSGKVMMDFGEQPYKESTREAIHSTEQLMQRWHGAANGRLHYALAPRFVLTCSKELWEAIGSLARESGVIIHTHSSENRKELEIVQQLTGYRNIEFFVKNGLASSKLALAHCIWISREEIEYLRDYGINVLHCPAANLKLGSGVAPVPELLAEGINVSLGSDGAPCNNNLDIFNELRLAALIHKPGYGVSSLTAGNVFDMVTINGAKTLGMEKQIGSIEAGKQADLTVLDLNKVHTVPADNLYSQLVYSARSADVKHVMINGEWVVRDGNLLVYDTEEVIRQAWQECQSLLKRLT